MKNKNGFTMIEYVITIGLILTLTIILAELSHGFIYSMRTHTITINLRENAEVVEKFIKRELNKDVAIDSVYKNDIGWVPIDSFDSGEINAIYYNEKREDGSTIYHAFNFKSDTNKILLRKELTNKISSLASIGGYEIAAGIKSIYLEKSDNIYRFVIELIDNNVIYNKEVFIYK